VRKYLYLAAAAASAAIVVLPAISAQAAVPRVLTTGKVGGPAVRSGDVLKAHLVTGSSAVFSLGNAGTVKLTCTSANFSATVRSNPAKPGTATESLTALNVAKCTVSGIQGVTFKSLKFKNLPYKVTVSDAKGFPVKVSEQSLTTPLKFTATVSLNGNAFSCSYKAASAAGQASNTGNTVAFSKQKFTKAGGNAACLGPAHLSAKFGPVRDTSVMNSPKVFVN
jgi:hypothetical protein